MNILEQAQAKREALQGELARIESFLATAYELQQEFGDSTPKSPVTSDRQKADLPAKTRRTRPASTGSVTVRTVAEILTERGTPLSTHELLPLVRAKGVEVGGKDALATLSARISQKGVVTVTDGKWWFSNNSKALSAKAFEGEAADSPAKEQSAASLFHSNEGQRHAAALAS